MRQHRRLKRAVFDGLVNQFELHWGRLTTSVGKGARSNAAQMLVSCH